MVYIIGVESPTTQTVGVCAAAEAASNAIVLNALNTRICLPFYCFGCGDC